MTDEDVESEAETAEDGEDDGGLQHGDFVRIDLTARTVEDGQLVDTTDPEVAEEEGVDEEGATFEPRVIPLGEAHLFDAVQDDVVGREVGYEGTVVVPAAEAFGEYDPEQVRTVSADKIPEDDRYPGAHVDVEGQHGHVETIVGGRARVDFNHPLAGDDVEYEYEILAEIDDPIGQAEGLFGMYFDGDFEMWMETEEVEREVPVESEEGEAGDEGEADEEGEPETETELVEETALYVEAPQQIAMNQQWLFQKNQVARDVMERLDLDKVVFQETVEGGMGGMGGMGMGMGGMGGVPGDEADVEEVVEELEEELPDEDVEELEEELPDDGEAEAEPE